MTFISSPRMTGGILLLLAATALLLVTNHDAATSTSSSSSIIALTAANSFTPLAAAPATPGGDDDDDDGEGGAEGAPAFVGGPKNTGDGTEIACDLPGNLHRQNTSSFGLGLCVFTSIHHSAVWQNVPQLQEFPKWLISSRVPGGGYPEKVATLIPRICKDRGMPVPDYLQVQSNDLEILKLACKTGRMPAVTYGRSPTGRYGGGGISHMVSLPHADNKWFVVLDNNYPGENKYEWMSPQQFSRISYGSPGWAVILLAPPPPPPPRN